MKHAFVSILTSLTLCCSVSGIKPGEVPSLDCPPTSAFLFRDMVSGKWQEAMAEWRSQVKTVSGNLSGDTGGNNTSFAQSFVPHCDRIAVIEVCLCLTSGTGWIRFDVHADDNNRPSDKILSRTWLQVDRRCPIPDWGYMPFYVHDISVTATQKYWFTFVEYPSKDSQSQSLTNLGSSRGNQYPEGQLLRSYCFQPSNDEDAKFQIIAKCPPVPGLREPTEEERASAPSPIWANGHWREELPCASREERESVWSRHILGLIGRLVIRQSPYTGRLCLGIDLYNDSGYPLIVPLWSTQNVHIEVWTQNGKKVCPTVERNFFGMMHKGYEVSLPPLCYVSYSLPTSGAIGSSLQWEDRKWTLLPGVYELRGEYFSLSDLSLAQERNYLWDGRLTLPPIRILIKDDGTAEPFALPNKK